MKFVPVRMIALLLMVNLFSQVTRGQLPAESPIDTTRPLPFAKPRNWGFITNVPGDLLQLGKAPFQKKNLAGLAMVAASSAILIWQDQPLLDGAMQMGRNIHWDPETHYKVLVKMGTTKIVKMPLNINTALYQMGEGGTSMILAGGMFIYGKIKHDYRALQTASDITETFITMGIGTQVLKRCFGRQSPFMRTQPGGKWTPFPSFAEYQRNTSNYDGFPSGHLATLMATVTVICDNYPEKKWIRPVGYVFTGLVGFAMMNTEVHWIGDYPLGLALGYLSGKITTSRHKQKRIAMIP